MSVKDIGLIGLGFLIKDKLAFSFYYIENSYFSVSY